MAQSKNLVKEKAIILSKTKYGEADLILKVITSEGEVYSVMARSALKSKKRFGGGVLEPTHYIMATVSKNADMSEDRLSILDEAHVIDDFRGLKTDYDRLELAFHLVKTVSIVAREGDVHREMFNLIGHSLKVAETAKNLQVLKMQFNLKLLHLQGVLPPNDLYLPLLKASVREADGIQIDLGDLRLIGAEVDFVFSSYVL